MVKQYRCKYLNHGLYVCFEKFRHCHLSVHAPSAREDNFIMKYIGPEQKPDWDYIFAEKQRLSTMMKNGDFPSFCKNCAWIETYEEEDFPEEDLSKLNIMWVSHFNACNCACTYCDNYEHIIKKETVKGYDILPLLTEMYEKKLFDPKLGRISFGLGEPTMSYNFENIINLSMQNNIRIFDVYSNGTVFSKMVSEGLMRDDMYMHLVISLDSGSREVYKKIKSADFFDKVCENIKKYAESVNKSSQPEQFQVKYILVPGVNDTKEEVDKWYDFCVNKAGVKALIGDIEQAWFIKNQHNIPTHIVELCAYMKHRAEKDGLFFEFFDRAKMLNIK